MSGFGVFGAQLKRRVWIFPEADQMATGCSASPVLRLIPGVFTEVCSRCEAVTLRESRSARASRL